MYLIVNHFCPNTLYIVDNLSQDYINKLITCDYNVEELRIEHNIGLFSWHDEDIFQYGGGNTLKDIKNNVVNHCKMSMDEYEYDLDDIVEEVYTGLIYINPYIPRVEFEGYEWEYFEETIKNSFVDNDSYRCYALVDFDKQEVILKGENDIEFYNEHEFINMFFK